MDLRSLIAKMDSIEQRKLLVEAEELMERLHNQDIMATARIDNETERLATLGKMAKENGYAGLFDPVTGKFVNTDGKFASIGAYQNEIEQLERHGLLPPNADTSSIFGLMGKDQSLARQGNRLAMDRDQAVERAKLLMKKATSVSAEVTPASNQSGGAAQPKKESIQRNGIAQQLLEEFGYAKAVLVESITKEEHLELKQIINSLSQIKNDEDVAVVLDRYQAYIERRNELLKEISQLIDVLKSKKKPETTKEHIQESIANPNRVMILEDGFFLKEGIVWKYNPVNETFYHFDHTGKRIEISESDWKQTAQDASRVATSGFTLGWADELYSGAKSIIKGTPYAVELKKELAKTAAAKERLGTWTSAGAQIAGSALNPITWFAPWISGAFEIGSEMWAKPKLATKAISDYEKEQGKKKAKAPADTTSQSAQPATPTAPTTTKAPVADKPATTVATDTAKGIPSDPTVKELQQRLVQQGFSVGKWGDDGKFGPDTIAGLKAYAQKNNTTPRDAIPKILGIDVSTLAEASVPPGAVAKVPWIAKVLEKAGINIADDAITLAAKGLAKSENVGGKVWEWVPGTTTYIEKGTGKSITSQELAGLKKANVSPEMVAQAERETAGGVIHKAEPGNPNYNAARGEQRVGSDGKTYERSEGGGWFEVKNGTRTANPAPKAVQQELNVAKPAQGPNVIPPKATTTAELTAAEKTVASKFGPTATKILQRIKTGGGKILGWLKNHKLLTLVAALAAFGYLFNDNGDVVSDSESDTATGDQQGGQPEDTVSPEETRLCKLLQQLYDGWPADDETQQAINAAGGAGAKCKIGGGAQPSGMTPLEKFYNDL